MTYYTCNQRSMASKRPCGSGEAAGPNKKKKAYCHFRTAWKSQEFTVTVRGVEKPSQVLSFLAWTVEIAQSVQHAV